MDRKLIATGSMIDCTLQEGKHNSQTTVHSLISMLTSSTTQALDCE